MGRASSRITYADAAAILGCGVSNIPKLIRRGLLTSHTGRGKGPALERAEVEQLAHARRLEAAEADVRRSVRAASRDQRPKPIAGAQWLTPPQVAELMGITSQAVRYHCRKGTIPHVRVGSRWWIREDHARLAANARAADGPEAIMLALDGLV